MTRRLTVCANEELAAGFHLVTLEGAALRGIAWRPGQTLRIAVGSPLQSRTYTPVEWNPSAGRVCLLGYAHGTGPGSLWLRGAIPGTPCDMMEPRTLGGDDRLAGSVALFGDETSIGLAYALARRDHPMRFAGWLEVQDPNACRSVLKDLALDGVELIERDSERHHVAHLEWKLPSVASDYSFVLTGRACTVRHLRHRLEWLGVASVRIIARDHWHPGKTGIA